MKPYIFFRKVGWYPIELKDDADAIWHANNNPGTLKVENAVTGEVVWKDPHSEDQKEARG